MVIIGRIFKLTAPNETDKCWSYFSTGSISEALTELKELYQLYLLNGVGYTPQFELIKYPSCKAKLFYKGEFANDEALLDFWLTIAKSNPKDIYNNSPWKLNMVKDSFKRASLG